MITTSTHFIAVDLLYSSSLSSLILSTIAEQRFDKGQFIIVPAPAENATSDQVRDWHNATT